MDAITKNLLIRELKMFLNKLENDNVECDNVEAMRIVETVAHEPMSKESALIHTGFSRAKFDDYCRRGLLPKGQKRQGWKELCWYRDELNSFLMLIKNNRYA